MSPISLGNPIAEGIVEHHFTSSFDGLTQTFLEKDFCEEESKAERFALIYLHGAASHQDQGMTAGIYLGAFEKWREELVKRQAVYICPEYRGASWMGPAAEADILDIIRLVAQRYHLQRLIISGASMGGTSALVLACRFPAVVHGVIALCPATDPLLMFDSFPDQFVTSYGGTPAEMPGMYAERTTRDRTGDLAALPIAIVHGSDDGIIGVEHSRILVQRLQKDNGRCLYIEIPQGDHDAPLEIGLTELLQFVLVTKASRIGKIQA